MVYFAYAISSRVRKYIYVGLTDDHIRRTKQHNDGKEKTTRAYAPFDTLLIEEYPTRALARKREKYLKSGAGKEFLKTLKLFSKV
jgi:putative endonuclease